MKNCFSSLKKHLFDGIATRLTLAMKGCRVWRCRVLCGGVLGQCQVQHEAAGEGRGECSAEDAELGLVEHHGSVGAEVCGVGESSNEHGDGESDAAYHADAGQRVPVGSGGHLADTELDADPCGGEHACELADEQSQEDTECDTGEEVHE